MSDKRKLLAEVDRTLKKVQEGMDIFDEIWEKVQEAPTQAQKEKCEVDLKKEIKKLQRLRDQIKTWITSCNDVKDKDPLVKARRDIESKMEKFKDVERETKTKVYSKAGLAQAVKLDINQKKKSEARVALTQFIEKMNCDLEQYESEMEDLEASARKKKLEKDKLEKVDFLKAIMESHRAHITKIEIMLRMLDNDSLDSDTIFGITDDFQFYLDKAEEGILEDVGYVYEGINLEEVLPESPPPSPEPSVTSRDSDDITKRKSVEEVTLAAKTPVKPLALTSTRVESKLADSKPLAGSSPTRKSSGQSIPNPPPQPPLIQAYAAAAAKALPQVASKSAAPLTDEILAKVNGLSLQDTKARKPLKEAKPTTPVHVPPSASPHSTGGVAGGSGTNTPQPSPIKDSNLQNGLQKMDITPLKESRTGSATDLQRERTPSASVKSAAKTEAESLVEPTRTPQFSSVPLPQSPIAPPVSSVMTEIVIDKPVLPKVEKVPEKLPFPRIHSAGEIEKPAEVDWSSPTTSSIRSSSLLSESRSAPSAVPLLTKDELEVRITPLMAMVPLGPGTRTNDMLLQYNRIDAAFRNPPKPCDSERRRTFIPCMQCPVPDTWPKQPPMSLVCDLKFYAALSVDALFFMFYYQEGSLAQVLAAKTLKSKNWRFHKQLNAWFQRLEEPKLAGPDYERGNYKYWDLESWSEQEKHDFIFEYRHLENVDLNRWPYS